MLNSAVVNSTKTPQGFSACEKKPLWDAPRIEDAERRTRWIRGHWNGILTHFFNGYHPRVFKDPFTYYFLMRDRGDVTAFRFVFIAQVNDSADLSNAERRQALDADMRKRLAEISSESLLQVFHGVSIIGTRMRFYWFDKRSGPLAPPVSSNIEDWEADITDDKGYEALATLARSIPGATSEVGEIPEQFRNP